MKHKKIQLSGQLLTLTLAISIASIANSEETIIGAREITPTALQEGAFISSPNGSGNECTIDIPCSIQTAFPKLRAGDILFLRGGTYTLRESLVLNSMNNGSAESPVIIESYPEELAILDGNENNGRGIAIYANYIRIRNLEITRITEQAIQVTGSYNIIEGCHVHDNHALGIQLYDPAQYKTDPYQYGHNIVRDNKAHHNSDVGGNANGGNADGISISSGKNNIIEHNTVYSNSDDGIDTWFSNNTYIAFNRVYDNGKGNGDGNGIKAGGDKKYKAVRDAPHGKNAIVEYNLSYNNKRNGFDFNLGKNVTFRYNTAYKNAAYSFYSAADYTGTPFDDTLVQHNIALENGKNTIDTDPSNSWQENGTRRFISTDSNSENFLKPETSSFFANMGAYSAANPAPIIDPVPSTIEPVASSNEGNAKVFIIGDSTVHNHDFPNSNGGFLEEGWGDVLGEYMPNKNNLYNKARSGASSKSYKTASASGHDWDTTQTLISNTDITEGGYLLIQFSHNDEHEEESQHTEAGQSGLKSVAIII